MADEPTHDPPHRVRVEITLRTMLLAAAVCGGVWLLTKLWPIVIIVIVAAILAGTLTPIVDTLEERGFQRVWAVLFVFIGATGLLAVLLILILPPLGRQMFDLWEQLPMLQSRLAAALDKSRLTVAFADTVRRWRPTKLWSGTDPATAMSWAESFGYAMTSIVLALYLVADRESARGLIYAVVPRSFHVRLARILLNLETIVGGYMRGQLITSFAIAVFVFILLTICQVPGALALAVFAGLTDVIPFVGGLLASGPAILAALSRNVGLALTVGIALVVYQEFESRILVPRIYGRALRMPPAAVLIALVIGGKLLGIVGALLALPIAAALRTIVQELRVNLPGDSTDTSALRERDAQAEKSYAALTTGTPPAEAAAVASRIAGEIRKTDNSAKITLGHPDDKK